MYQYIIRRFLYMIPMLIGITSLSFFIMQLAPGDFLTAMQMSPDFPPEMLAQMRAQYGLDQPVYVQYFQWIFRVFQGDLGYSFMWHAPVTWVLHQRIWNTLLLAVAAMVVAWLVAIPIGIHSATHQYSWSDKLLTFFAFIGISIPNWFFGLLMLYFVVSRGWNLPIGGMMSTDFQDLSLIGKAYDLGRHMLIPVLVLSTGIMAGLMRYMRSNLLDVLKQDYVTTARSKGLRARVVINKHAVRNAINPLITLFGFQLGTVFSGAALTEIVLNWPGIGSLMLTAVQGLDYYLVMGNLIVGGVMLILGNLMADLLLAWSDPRIRFD